MLLICLFPAELGDYDPEVHTPGFISEFRFIPEQTEELELAIFEAFKTKTYDIIGHRLS